MPATGFAPALLFSFMATSPHPTKIWLKETSENIRGNISSYELGNGIRWIVSSQEIEGARAIQLRDNAALFYVESSETPKNAEIVAKFDDKLLVTANKSWNLASPNQFDYYAPVSISHFNNSKNITQYADRIENQDQLMVNIDSIIDISENSLLNNLKILTGDLPINEIDGKKIVDRSSQAGRELTQAFLIETFKTLGLSAEKKCYSSWRGNGCNIEATLWGDDTASAVYFTAHYDSVTRVAADDNASGTVALIEMARLLSAQKPKKTVRFVAFDHEEKGLVGSSAYVTSIKKTDPAYPAYAINLDMIGFDKNNDGAIHIIDCNKKESIPLSSAVLSAIAQTQVPLTRSDTCTNRSDHASFWSKSIPAIVISENFFGGDGNDCYHSTCDTIEKMNLPYFYSIVKMMTNLAWGMVN